jgi:hypothetical protein
MLSESQRGLFRSQRSILVLGAMTGTLPIVANCTTTTIQFTTWLHLVALSCT